MCDPEKSGIDDDPRLPYYSHIENWTAKYAASIGMYDSYGYDYHTANCIGSSLLGFMCERMPQRCNISALEV